jgi:outer membrane protein assembly factor BamB
VPSPVDVGEGRVFLSGGYNAGSMMLQLKEEGGKWSVETLFRLKPTVFGATQQTPVFHQGHLFGIRPDGQFVCLDLSGKSLWESGAENRYGNGPFLFAGHFAFLMNDSGLLTLAEATTSGFKKIAQAKVLPGPDAWGPMALADGRLMVRDLTQMVCLEVAPQK